MKTVAEEKTQTQLDTFNIFILNVKKRFMMMELLTKVCGGSTENNKDKRDKVVQS